MLIFFQCVSDTWTCNASVPSNQYSLPVPVPTRSKAVARLYQISIIIITLFFDKALSDN